MPLSSPTQKLATGETAFTGSSFTVGSAFTPSNNSLQVAFITARNGQSPATVTPSVSGGGYTWVSQGYIEVIVGSRQILYTVFTALVTTGVSTTLSVSNLFTGGSSTQKYNIEVYEFTGHNTSSPIGATATGTNATAGAISITLSGAPASTSYVLAGSALTPNGGGGTTTAGTGWTALYNEVGPATYLDVQQQSITGTTSTNVPWQVQLNGDTVLSSQAVQIAVEIKAAAATNPTPSDCSFLFQSPFLGPTPKSTQNTNQAFNYQPPQPKTPTSPIVFRPAANLRHIPTIYTAQSFVCNPTIGPPIASLGFWTQPLNLLNHPNTLNTNQPFASFQAAPSPVPSNQVNEYWSFAPIGHLAIGQGTLPAGTPTPADCSFLYQPDALLKHPQTLDTNQQKDNFFSGWANATPSQFGFWTQAPDLIRHPAILDTNQPVDQGWTQGLTPASLAFWKQPAHLLRHPSTLDTNQSFDAGFVGQANVTPSQLGFWAQSPDLLRHPITVDTNQPFDAGFAGQANTTPTAFGFWTQPQDLLRHPNTVDTRQQFEFTPPIQGQTPADCSFLFQAAPLLNHAQTLDTNQPLDDAFFGWAQNLTPTFLGFWAQSPDILRHPITIDTNQPFEFNPPPGAVTPADCSFLFEPAPLLNHPATLDTNQSLDDAFAGWARPLTPSSLGFWTQPLDLLRHPGTIDTNQPTVSYQDKATPISLAFWTQAQDLLHHPATVDTNQPLDDAYAGWQVLTPSQFGFWQQPQDLLRHPGTIDTNQPRDNMFSGWAQNITPTSFGFFTQAPNLLRHASTIDTNQAFVFNPPAPVVTPSAYWWFQSPDLLKHPATINTQQSFKFLPPPQPPFGWLIQAQDLIRHPIPFILGGQYSFALLPPKITANAIIKVYFFN